MAGVSENLNSKIINKMSGMGENLNDKIINKMARIYEID